MNYHISAHIARDRYSEWIAAMKSAREDITIGQNPTLPSIIQKTWGWPNIFMEFFLGSRLVASLSLVRIRKTWVSLPHFDHDSLWVDSDHIREKMRSNIFEFKTSVDALHRFFYTQAYKIIRDTGPDLKNGAVITVRVEPENFNINEPELWSGGSVNMISRNQYPVLPYCDNSKVIPVLNLKTTYDAQFETFPSAVRRKIRKAGKNGVVVETGGLELVNDFYYVYRDNIRSLGSFGLPKVFFQTLLADYNYGRAEIFIARLNGQAVGGAVLLTFLTHAENAWFSSLADFNRYYVTYALHDAMIRHSVQKGCGIYSFGRSTVNSSGHHYKQQWGTTGIPMTLSSIKKARFNPVKLTFASRLIRLLPDALLNRLDSLVSTQVY